MVGEEDPLPVRPIFFDKKRLMSDEFKPYIYEIEFKKSGKKVKDMQLAGYVHAITPYLRGVDSEVLHYGFAGERKILCAVVRATVTISFKSSEHGTASMNDMKFSALADGDATNVPSVDALVRTVETRAIKRALARALDISKVDLNDQFVEEEEVCTPMSSEADEPETPRKSAFPKGKTPSEIRREKEKQIEDAERGAGNDQDESGKETDW